jgi:hypothetical protein
MGRLLKGQESQKTYLDIGLWPFEEWSQAHDLEDKIGQSPDRVIGPGIFVWLLS